jgi:hypothetical protein
VVGAEPDDLPARNDLLDFADGDQDLAAADSAGANDEIVRPVGRRAVADLLDGSAPTRPPRFR